MKAPATAALFALAAAFSAPAGLAQVREGGPVPAERIAAGAPGSQPQRRAGFSLSEWDVGIGYRQDANQWTISVPGVGPDILSDLEWSDLRIVELQGRARWRLGRSFGLRTTGAVGAMFDGENRDSDYARSGRSGEFSRSIADTDGWTLDLSAAIERPFALGGDGRATIAPMFGYAFSHQNHNDTNGRQIVNNPCLAAELDGEEFGGSCSGETGPFGGLNSDYEATWHGPFIGVRLALPLGDRWKLGAEYQLHYFDYHAEMFWNLRNRPFESDSDGFGHRVNMEIARELRQGWSVGARANWSVFNAEDGTQSIPGGTIRLNEADWESWSAGLFLRRSW